MNPTTQQTEKFLNDILNGIWNKNLNENIWTQSSTNTPVQKPKTTVKKPLISTIPTWYEVETGFEYHLDVPGFNKEELSLVYEDKTRSISVSGTKSTVIGDHSLNRSVNQVLRIPEEAQATVSAALENGVLILSVPREQNLRRNILIQ